MLYASFQNIFVSDLYELGYPEVHNATALALQFPNATRDFLDGLSPEVVAVAQIHTLWFALWVVGDVLFGLFLWSYARRLRLSNSWAWSEKTRCCGRFDRKSAGFFYVRMAISVVHIVMCGAVGATLSMYFFAYNGNDRNAIGTEGDDSPVVQQIVHFIYKNSGANVLFPLVMACAPIFAIPDDVGLTITVACLRNLAVRSFLCAPLCSRGPVRPHVQQTNLAPTGRDVITAASQPLRPSHPL